MIAALLACREPPAGEGHTGGGPRSLPERCPESPCVTELASAVVDEPGASDEGGQVVVVAEEWAFVQAPGIDRVEHVAVFHLPELEWVGQWDTFQLASGALVAGDVTGDGDLDLLVGRPNVGDGATIDGLPFIGSVALLDRLPNGREELDPNAVLTFAGPREVGVGPGISIADVDADGVADLTVSGLGHCCRGGTSEPSGVWVFDPVLRGPLQEADAKLHFAGEYGRWNKLVLHDLEGDGSPELWETRGVLLGHQLPLTDGEADVSPVVQNPSQGHVSDSFALGDVTGDGVPDLAAYFLDLPDEDRAGVLTVLPGGEWDPALPVDAATTRVTGSRVGDAMGVSAVSADVTGDGVLDLVVGASGVFPGLDQPGRVLVFEGPIDGALTESDAVAVVVGEYAADNFGRSVAVTDADGDARADLVIGAFGYPGGYADGRVYVVPGAALVP